MTTSSPPTPPAPTKAQHLTYLNQTITLAKQSPPLPTNFRVGCVLVSYPSPSPSSSSTSSSPRIISTGYTLELPGNTHAEQNALSKLTLSTSTAEEDLHTLLPARDNVILYTSLEPCSLRLSGNRPCVQRIIDTRSKEPSFGIQKVVFGAKEPDTFVQDSASCKLLSEAGVEWEYISDLEGEILRVAMEGHGRKGDEMEGRKEGGETAAGGEMQFLHNRVDAMGASGTGDAKVSTDQDNEEERRRKEAEAQPRNSKKRMMEL